MRWQLTILAVVAACGDDLPIRGGDASRDVGGSTTDSCELGQDRWSDAVAALHDADPGCTRDDECVLLHTDVFCTRFRITLCGDIVHRDVVSRWNPAAVCAPLDALPGGGQACSITASCVGGTPRCLQGRCGLGTDLGTDLGALDASTARDAQRD